MTEEVKMHYISDRYYWVLGNNRLVSLREVRPNESYNRALAQVKKEREGLYRCFILRWFVPMDSEFHDVETLEEGMKWVELQLVIKRLEGA